jgi:hypothetical protein
MTDITQRAEEFVLKYKPTDERICGPHYEATMIMLSLLSENKALRTDLEGEYTAASDKQIEWHELVNRCEQAEAENETLRTDNDAAYEILADYDTTGHGKVSLAVCGLIAAKKEHEDNWRGWMHRAEQAESQLAIAREGLGIIAGHITPDDWDTVLDACKNYSDLLEDIAIQTLGRMNNNQKGEHK